jgi:hypothetical protein
LAIVVIGFFLSGQVAAASGNALEINVLSNRADLLSGGDALVEIVLPSGANVSDLTVQLAAGGSKTDITSMFALRPNGKVQGLVTGVPLGDSALVASAKAKKARLGLTNYPIGGPIFAGPQVQPWFCGTRTGGPEAGGLGPPLDEQCNMATKVEYLYLPIGSTTFQPYDLANPPGNVAETTTDQGKTVSYIVRREQGTLDRGIYSFAVLFDPAETVSPWSPPQAWNGKLYYPFGGGAAPSNYQGTPGSVLLDLALSRGFAVATTSLNTFGNNANSVVSAETVMMLKEHIVEEFGPIRYTFAQGGSGGAMQQHLITNAYPGLLDGIQPSASFADLYKNNREVQDCDLLVRYFHQTSPGLWPDSVQRNAVYYNENVLPGTCESWPGSRLPDVWGNPRVGCAQGSAVIFPWMYDPITNPTGTRCTIQDYQKAMFGSTGPNGWAGAVYDNVGVEYGLDALNKGLISAEQFVDLNEKVGGGDIDRNWTPERAEADPYALWILFRTGQLNLGTGMNTVPIIDVRNCSNVEIHSCYHSWVMRERLEETHGTSANQVIFVQSPANTSFDVMDRWLAAIEADNSNKKLAAKVVANKPADAFDACWLGGVKTPDGPACQAAYRYFGNPHFGAGDTIEDDVMKCQLKKLRKYDHDATFTDSQWARLQATFPDGVCDWRKPSVGYTKAVQWLDYTNGTPGRPLAPAPESR